MTPQSFLRYQLTLLLAQYGNKKVIAELKKILSLSEKDIESLLVSIGEEKIKKEKETNGKNIKKISFEINSEPSKRERILKEIYSHYSLKNFLPELKDVRHFLDGNSSSTEKIINRTDAKIKILKVLSSLDDKELEFIIDNINSKEKSSLGIISDEILKKN
ncbi:hypothetical protein IM876_24875 [Serratia plymuthica]|uniref:hypothetical protein n=1 Tax=Serratia plymuthica TaxID=82996 RepID=UPI001927E91A|nr:hypothetical protein [Serratia plymuthica]MBL3525901.1 hypothetical protein [Serratia plymuthica]